MRARDPFSMGWGTGGSDPSPSSIQAVRIDASTKCQLQCPGCTTGDGRNRAGTIGWGHLAPEEFRDFLDRHPDIRAVELSNWGEITLNPGLPEILRIGHERGVALSAVNGNNLNDVKEEVLEALVRYRLRAMRVSIDGATRESYSKFRQGGRLEKVIGNIRTINRFKRIHGSLFPELHWVFILFGHNQHEVAHARRLAKRLGMSFTTALNFTPQISPVDEDALLETEPLVQIASMRHFKERTGRDYLTDAVLPCPQLWLKPQINWDGKLLGCCCNTWGDYGNVFEEGMESCLTSERYDYAKRMLLGKEVPREDIPCTNCGVYHELRATEKYDALKHKLRNRLVF